MCNSDCGDTPPEFRATRRVIARPDQCYHCEQFDTRDGSSAPGTCQFRYDAVWEPYDQCCNLHSCTGSCLPDEPLKPQKCQRPSGCTSGCGTMPPEALIGKSLQFFVPQPSAHQCFWCGAVTLDGSGLAPPWCQFGSGDTCCVLHDCIGECEAAPRAKGEAAAGVVVLAVLIPMIVVILFGVLVVQLYERSSRGFAAKPAAEQGEQQLMAAATSAASHQSSSSLHSQKI